MNTKPIEVDIKLIHPNPWQPRKTIDPATVAELAASIHRQGLLQPPLARVVNGHFELAFGHRRFVAWQQANPQQPMPLEVRPLTDREMAEMAAAENGQREDLNPIERAQNIHRLITEFSLSQLEAGKFYGLTTQGAVSNVLGLLKHPPQIIELVGQGAISERNARDLRLAARVDAKAAVTIAQGAAKEDEADRSEFIREQVGRLLDRKGRDLERVPWELNWPKAPIAVTKPDTAKGEPAQLIACTACPFHFRYGNDHHCAHPPCFDLKFKAGIQNQLAESAAKSGIPAAGPDEKITVIFDGNDQGVFDGPLWEREKWALAAVKAKLPALRFAPLTTKTYSYHLHSVTGSNYIALAATDKAAVRQWAQTHHIRNGEIKKKAANAPPKNENDKEKANRLALEAKEQMEWRTDRAAFQRGKHDVIWLLQNTARLLAGKIQISGGVLELAEAHIHQANPIMSAWVEIYEAEDALSQLKQATDAQRREHIALDVLGHNILGWNKPATAYHWGKALTAAEKIVAGKFGVKLPAGWNKPPIHHTEYNCWTCGVFAPGGKLTKRDFAEGWMEHIEKGRKVEVTCPDCSPKKK
jgi:ParB/RepB/Spo0J family partition protein